MIAIDTNLLTRLLLQDDAVQHKKVKALFKTNQIFTTPVTVMLELVWVLESRDCSADQITSGLTALMDLPNFKPEREDALRGALRSYKDGMGFADALHLALREGQQKFMTFDRAFVRQGKKLGLRPELVLM
ncbi:MAG: type II toxin-antitoxin system VapC family toxin [Polaromonas sp.]|nr:type II toxin-antitoxin system VapC family toxin [Polaromonas sp.]